jgi:hypothetical protein
MGRHYSGRSRLPLSNDRCAVVSGYAGINMRTAAQADQSSMTITECTVKRHHPIWLVA